ncbi:MAG: hypothetical protein P8182_10330 [Deltaproteobacteria bacterium]
MAKPDMQLTPEELLKIIRAGALKDEIIQQHKTSEQELALALLPAYRNGELTKEEFNTFFQGMSLRPQVNVEQDQSPGPLSAGEQVESPPVQEKPQKASPEPQGGFAGLFTRKSPKEPEKQSEAEGEEAPTGRDGALDRKEEPRTTAVRNEPEKAVPQEAAAEAVITNESVEAPQSAAGLEVVLARLDSIDRRLARIEEKLGLT